MRTSFNFLVFALSVLSTIFLVSCDKKEEINSRLELTSEEEYSLLYMREEEKLARDVYVYLFERYNLDIFENISASEQKHMDFVLDLMSEYGLDDNAALAYGEFNNHELQLLYDELIAKGSLSLYDALIVGATIEDVDIYDLNSAYEETIKTDLIDLYGTLLCASKNHMRAFTDRVSKEGPDYVPQFISQEEYDLILAASHEPCG